MSIINFVDNCDLKCKSTTDWIEKKLFYFFSIIKRRFLLFSDLSPIFMSGFLPIHKVSFLE